MSSPVTCSMVKTFLIDEGCRGDYLHYCTITLNDGREKDVCFEHGPIANLIDSIAAEKLLFNCPITGEKPTCADLTHFTSQKDGSETADQILTRVFKKA